MTASVDRLQGSRQIQDAAEQLRGCRDTKGLCLLSFDGGGVRGLSSLLILQYLMNKVNEGLPEKEKKRPCEVFNMIGGTSTGGLIAIMLGRLKMDVDECIKVYNTLINDIFHRKLRASPINFTGNLNPRFDTNILRQSMVEVVGKYGIPDEDSKLPTTQRMQLAEKMKLDDGTERGCKTFVCATSSETKLTVKFRDYSLTGFKREEVTIVDAARATSAATTFFEPASIGNRKYQDGGLGANNPVDQVYIEASNLWDEQGGQLSNLLKCFISIGTGNPGIEPINDSVWGFFRNTLVEMVTETEATAGKFADRHKDIARPDGTQRYFRFNVAQGLQGIGLEEYLRAGDIEAATQNYMEDLDQRTRVEMCAKTLKLKECVSLSWEIMEDYS